MSDATEMILTIIGLLVAIAGGIVAFFEYKKSKKINAIDKFISYREKLKTNESLKKIVTHIQKWQNDVNVKSQIPEDISLFDFYYFLGYYEEIYIVTKSSYLKKDIVKNMFRFYAIEIADNCHYWEKFGEDYRKDDSWKLFKKFVDETR